MNLGETARDRITGFEGVVTGLALYISGCDQALLAPPVDKEGRFRDGLWFDIRRLVRIDGPTIVLDNGAPPGCDRAAPKR